MRKKVTVLDSIKSKGIEKLLAAHAANPYHARVLHLSSGFSATHSKLIKEEYFDENGQRNADKFRLFQKLTRYTINENFQLVVTKETPMSFCFNKGKFTKRKRIYPTGKKSFSTLFSVDSDSSDSVLSLRNIFNSIGSHPSKIVVTEWLSAFPWMTFLAEHKILMREDLNKLYEQKIFTLKKALKYKYDLPYPKSQVVHNAFENQHKWAKIQVEKNHPELPLIERIIKTNSLPSFFIKQPPEDEVLSRKLSYEFFDDFGLVLSNRENFNMDWLYDTQLGKLSWNVCKFAKLLDRTVDCKWSDSRLNDINNKWTKEYAAIIYEYNNKPLSISDVFKRFEEHSTVHMIKDLQELHFEGWRQNHCVGNYENTIAAGDTAIYHFKDFTFQLGWGVFDSKYSLDCTLREKGLRITEFRGFANCSPSTELRNEVENMVKTFNRHILTLPYADYKALAENVIEHNELFSNRSRDTDDIELVMPLGNDINWQPRFGGINMQIDEPRFGGHNFTFGGPAVIGFGNVEDPVDEVARIVERHHHLLDERINTLVDEVMMMDDEAFGDAVMTEDELIEEVQLEHEDIITVDNGNGGTFDFRVNERNELVLLTDVARNNEQLVEYLDANELVLADDTVVHEAEVMDATEEVERFEELTEALDNLIAVTDGGITINVASINTPKELTFFDILDCIITAHEEQFGESVEEGHYDEDEEYVRTLFLKIARAMNSGDGINSADFAYDNKNLINKATRSLEGLDSAVMREIISEVETEIEMIKNPYFDLLAGLREEFANR